MNTNAKILNNMVENIKRINDRAKWSFLSNDRWV
jgi:hypothetical protein